MGERNELCLRTKKNSYEKANFDMNQLYVELANFAYCVLVAQAGKSRSLQGTDN